MKTKIINWLSSLPAKYRGLLPMIAGVGALFLMEYAALDPKYFLFAMMATLGYIGYMRVYFARMARFDLRGEEKANAWLSSGKNSNTLAWRAGVFTVLMVIYGVIAIIPEDWFFWEMSVKAMEGDRIVRKNILYDLRPKVFYIYVFIVVSYSMEVVQWILRRVEELKDRDQEKEDTSELARLKKERQGLEDKLEAELGAQLSTLDAKHAEALGVKQHRIKELVEELQKTKQGLLSLQNDLGNEQLSNQAKEEQIETLNTQLKQYKAGAGNLEAIEKDRDQAIAEAERMGQKLKDLQARAKDLDKLDDLRKNVALFTKSPVNQKIQKIVEVLGGHTFACNNKTYSISEEGELVEVASNNPNQPTKSLGFSVSESDTPTFTGFHQAHHDKNMEMAMTNGRQVDPPETMTNDIGEALPSVMTETLTDDRRKKAQIGFINGMTKAGLMDHLNISESEYKKWKEEDFWQEKKTYFTLTKKGLSNEKIASKFGVSERTLYRREWYEDIKENLSHLLPKK